jgi:hypothetical protein
MKMQLTEEQARRYEAILWLTDPLGSRGTGRTQLLAMAYIQHSITGRCWVSIVNHGLRHPMANRELINRIVYLVGGTGFTVKIKGMDRSKPSILVEPIIKIDYQKEKFVSPSIFPWKIKDDNAS